MPVAAKKLTQELISKYAVPGDRQNTLRFIIDTRAGRIYVLAERPVEAHSDIATAIAGLHSDAELMSRPSAGEHLVGAFLEAGAAGVLALYIGYSTIETHTRIHHSAKTLEKARAMAEAFVRNGTAPLAPGFKIEVYQL
jgi:hypothetical protein